MFEDFSVSFGGLNWLFGILIFFHRYFGILAWYFDYQFQLRQRIAKQLKNSIINSIIMSKQSFHLIEHLGVESKIKITQFLNTLLEKGSKPISNQVEQETYKEAQIIQQLFHDITKEFSTVKARQASRAERSLKSLSRNEYNYGQIEFATFRRVMELIKRKRNLKQRQQIFYDLGSGSGKVLLAALLCYNFKKCVGIELLTSLYEVSQKLKTKIQTSREQIQSFIMNNTKYTDFTIPDLQVLNRDFRSADWSEATIVFASSTCYSPELMKQLCVHSKCLQTGSIFITLTKKLQDYDCEPIWKCIQQVEGKTSWGNCTIYIQEKMM